MPADQIGVVRELARVAVAEPGLRGEVGRWEVVPVAHDYLPALRRPRKIIPTPAPRPVYRTPSTVATICDMVDDMNDRGVRHVDVARHVPIARPCQSVRIPSAAGYAMTTSAVTTAPPAVYVRPS